MLHKTKSSNTHTHTHTHYTHYKDRRELHAHTLRRDYDRAYITEKKTKNNSN